MSLREICQRITYLISSIFTADRELEEATTVAHLKARDSATLFIKAIKEKEVAALTIKHLKQSIGSVNDKILVWHEEYGIGVKQASDIESTDIEPLIISEDNFQTEQLISLIKSNLEQTLQSINSKKRQQLDRSEKLEQLIEILKQNW